MTAITTIRTARTWFTRTSTCRRRQRSSSTPANGPITLYGRIATLNATAIPVAVAARCGEKKNRLARAASNTPSPVWEASRVAYSRRKSRPRSTVRRSCPNRPPPVTSAQATGAAYPVAMAIGTPTHVSAVQGVADQLRAAIHRGDLAAGAQLPPERELATQLGVSRITLRESLRILIEEGYLEARRGSRGGTFVTELDVPYSRWLASMRADLSQFEDVLEFRIAVERGAARLAALRRDAADLARIDAAAALMEKVDDRASFRNADNAFHRSVADAARSPRLAAAIEAARSELFIHTDNLVYVELIAEAMEEHAQIRDAIVRGDETGAASAVEAHLEATRRGLRQLLLGQS